MPTPKVNFNVENQAKQASTPYNGISFFGGITKRGPIEDPDTVISSWPQFERIFGGLIDTSNFPFLCKRALEAGAKLRVSSIKKNAVSASIPAVQKITFSAALVALNVINLKLNAVSMDPVTYAGDSDATMALVAAEIKSHFPTLVEDADVIPVAGGVDNDRVIVVIPKAGETLVFSDMLVTLGVSQATMAVAAHAGIWDSTNQVPLFELAPKYAGLDYNNLTITIATATNGNANYFNLTVTHTVETDITETYENLKITNTTAANSHYLDTIVQSSALVDVTYKDLSALVGDTRPMNFVYEFTGGTDGDVLSAADYVGLSTTHTGLYAFNPYNDGYQICFPEMSTTAIHVAGEGYARTRKDLHYWAYLSDLTANYQDLIDEVDLISVDSKYIMYFAGIVKVLHPVTGNIVELPAMGDIVALAGVSDTQYAPYYSFAGPNRGVLSNVLGLKVNYGGMGSIGDLDMLANRGINIVINRDNQTMLWGNFTGSLANSPEKFANVVRLEYFIKKSLTPALERFIEEPTDFTMTRQMYYTVMPFLRSLKDNRATYDVPNWQGDQQATKLDELQINAPADFSIGKYKVKMSYTPIPALQEITIGIILTSAGVSFE